MHDTQIQNSHLLQPSSQSAHFLGWVTYTVMYQHTLQQTWHFQCPFGDQFLVSWPSHSCCTVLLLMPDLSIRAGGAMRELWRIWAAEKEHFKFFQAWCDQKKSWFFFLIGPLNLALLYSFSSQRYQHTAVQLPSTGARAQLTMQKVRKSCCAMDMLPQGMPSNEADRSWNSASVIKSCAHFISCHTDSWHPRNWMLRQLTGYSIWNKKTEGKTNDNFKHSISVAMVSGAGKTEGDYFCSLSPASTEKRVSSIDAIMNLASGSCPASIIESRHG